MDFIKTLLFNSDTMTNIWKNFSEYIATNYSNSEKIVEVGIGKITQPSDMLKKQLPQTEIKLVDLYPCNKEIIQDDITNPTDEIYENADLIYCIRPPEELQKDVVNLAKKYNSDLIIKPLNSEEINYNLQNKLKLVNYKYLSLYVMIRE